MTKQFTHEQITKMLDDPFWHLAIAEYPDEHREEIDAVNAYVRSITPALRPEVAALVPADLRILGQRKLRHEDPARLTGQALYASDVRLPGMLHTAILRSPHARARIEDIDTSAAEALAGVRAVLTYKNDPGESIGGPPPRFALNRDIHFAGEEVAAIAAEDVHTAREAVKLLKVRYTVLPSVTDMDKATAPGAPDVLGDGKGNVSGTPSSVKRGSFDSAYAAAAVKHEGTYSTTTLQHATLEPFATVARWEGPLHLRVWNSSQYIPGVRSGLASYFKLPRSHVRAICDNMGGGFGSKTGANRDAIIASILAKMTQRPVRLEYDRPGQFKSATHRFATKVTLKAGVDGSGKIVAYSAQSVGDTGAYATGASPLTPIQRLYQVGDAVFQHTNVVTNRGPSGAQRCVGDPQGTWEQEIFIDELAEKAAVDPVDFRLKNFNTIKDQDSNLPWQSNGIVDCVDKGAATIGWKQKWHKPAAKISGTKAHGIGMAAHGCGHGAMSAPMSQVIRVDRDGSLDLSNGLTEIGGGQSTAMMMIAAETVGVRFEDAFPAWGDSGFVPDTGGTYGSRGTPSAGSATLNAGLDLKYQLLQEAAKPRGSPSKPLLDGKPEDMDTGDGFVFLKADPSKRVAIKDVANATGSPMIGRGTHAVPPGYSQSVYAAGFAEVEVDLDTGGVTLLRYVAVDDLGKVINLLGCEQQIEGGVSMSIGLGLGEEMIFDPPTNVPVNATWENYPMPTVLEHPKWADFLPFVVESISKIGPYGAKGLGEPPTSPPAPAIANAIYNAIGLRIHDAPASRAKILAGIKALKLVARA